MELTSSAKVGQIFVDAREALELDQGQVAVKAVMNIKYIKGIESGDYSAFPSEGFAKAYFIKYQKFLSVNCDFPSIYDPESRQIEIAEKSIAQSNKSLFPIFASIGVIFLLLIIFIIANNFDYDAETKIDLSDSSNSLSVESPYVIEQDIINVRKEIIPPMQQSEVETNPLLENANELSLFFSGECWVEIYSDNELIEYQLFKIGDSFSLSIESPFKLVIGNADSITGTYKGNLIDFITNANRLRVNTIIFNDE